MFTEISDGNTYFVAAASFRPPFSNIHESDELFTSRATATAYGAPTIKRVWLDYNVKSFMKQFVQLTSFFDITYRGA